MLLGPTDLIPGLFALAVLFGCVQLLRYAARTVQRFPVLGLAASVAVLGWMHQHRAALPGAGANAPSGMLAQAGPLGGERPALGVHVSDGAGVDSPLIVEGESDAIVHFNDFPMIQSLMFANERTGRPIDARVGGLEDADEAGLAIGDVDAPLAVDHDVRQRGRVAEVQRPAVEAGRDRAVVRVARDRARPAQGDDRAGGRGGAGKRRKREANARGVLGLCWGRAGAVLGPCWGRAARRRPGNYHWSCREVGSLM